MLETTDFKEWIGIKEQKTESPCKDEYLSIGNFDLCDYENGYGKKVYDNWAEDDNYNREWDKEEDLECEDDASYPQELCWDNILPQINKTANSSNKTTIQEDVYIAPEQRTCFKCERNLDWACRDGNLYAYCGPYLSNGLGEQRVNPERAQYCKLFRFKKQ